MSLGCPRGPATSQPPGQPLPLSPHAISRLALRTEGHVVEWYLWLGVCVRRGKKCETELAGCRNLVSLGPVLAQQAAGQGLP